MKSCRDCLHEPECGRVVKVFDRIKAKAKGKKGLGDNRTCGIRCKELLQQEYYAVLAAR
jgi:hypothetical protein